MVKELKSPARDLPEGVILAVGEAIDAAVADELVGEEYAVEHDESEIADQKPLSQMNKAELQALAASLDVAADGTNDALRERIVAAQEAAKGGDA